MHLESRSAHSSTTVCFDPDSFQKASTPTVRLISLSCDRFSKVIIPHCISDNDGSVKVSLGTRPRPPGKSAFLLRLQNVRPFTKARYVTPRRNQSDPTISPMATPAMITCWNSSKGVKHPITKYGDQLHTVEQLGLLHVRTELQSLWVMALLAPHREEAYSQLTRRGHLSNTASSPEVPIHEVAAPLGIRSHSIVRLLRWAGNAAAHCLACSA